MRTPLRVALAVVLVSIALLAPSASASAGATRTAATSTTRADLLGVTQVETGAFHTCAVLTNTQVRCWGANDLGQLGIGSTSAPHPLPQIVLDSSGTAPLTGVTAIRSGNDFTCALMIARGVRCWGANGGGRLGDGTLTVRTLPVRVRDRSGPGYLGGVTQLSLGASHVCALVATGGTWCWGDNTYGQVGDNTTTMRPRPVRVRSSATTRLTGVTQLDAGAYHSCARLDTGQARCWGNNQKGQLGDGSGDQQSAVAAVVLNSAGSGPLRGVAAITAGVQHTCARRGDGEARCWGAGTLGQIGNGSSAVDVPLPDSVLNTAGTRPLAGVREISAGDDLTCVRLANTQMRCWGDDGAGGLGDDTTTTGSSIPVAVLDVAGPSALSGVVQITVGLGRACALLANGFLLCWGDNGAGAVGDGSFGSPNRPVVVQT